MSSSSFFEDDGNWFDEPFGSEESAPSTEAPAVSGPEGVTVVVVDADGATQAEIVNQLGGGIATFASLPELAARLTGAPVVAVLGPSISDDASLSEASHMLQTHHELGTILIAQELSTSLLQLALRSGVKDVLAAPIDNLQLLEAVDRVGSGLAPAPSSTHAVGADELYDEFGSGETGQVITVFSTKGGAGKSMLASNLGVVLAQRSERPVALVDADLQFGDIAVMLKLAPAHTLVDAVANADRLDEAMLRSLLTVHEPSGLLVMPAPLEPAFADQIVATEMIQIIEALRRFCSHVIIDTPAYFNDVVLGMIEMSDDVLLIAGMDIPNIKNVKIGLQTLRLLNTPMEKIRLVLNRANSKVKLDVSEVERTLQVSADSLLPSDVVVPQSINKGIPVVHASPRSGVARALEELANDFISVEGNRKRK